MPKTFAALLLSCAALSAQALNLNDLKNDLNARINNSPSQGAAPSGVNAISESDAVGGLKEALKQGATNAVGNLGVENGFFGNPRVKIPLPDSLQRVDSTLHRIGMGKYGDELILTINRAAEAAVPEAKALLWNAIKSMSIQDAKNILTGNDTAATEYFRGKTSQPLTEKFLPIVHQATDKVQLAQKYDKFAGKAVRFGLIDSNQANIEQFITQKALDGLFLLIADEERAIRAHPAEQASKLIVKVFGSLLK